ncbi:MAG: DUF1592 domain-containing protein [Opitutaceae bacterium]|nr:DUF1592 domain-containing protein [Verrucomicrobiales bacterium]
MRFDRPSRQRERGQGSPVAQGLQLRMVVACALLFVPAWSTVAAEKPSLLHFKKDVQPILAEYCSDCHANGSNKGNVDFDELASDAGLEGHHELWLKVLKNVRSGLMPPLKKPQPSPEERKQIENWIKNDAFGIDPNNPDPGRITIRRLNRVEYRNTIRDLMGVDFNTEAEFPPDDAGHGFDNIADVLTLSPMLLEKYLDAAKAIVARAVPMAPGVVAETVIAGGGFRQGNVSESETNKAGPLILSYYQQATASHAFRIQHAGRYQLVLDMTANEKYVENVFDYNKCRLIFKADGRELFRQEFVREGAKPFRFEFNREWQPGDHKLSVEVVPLTPDEKQIRSLNFRILSVTVRWQLEEKNWVKPRNYERFFTKDLPASATARRRYAQELLGRFAQKAFRGPVDEQTVNLLAGLAEKVYSQPKVTFEAGVAQAMVAILASPRFLFREEAIQPNRPAGKSYPLVDEYALASRLSYFLWSSMPDDELFRLAAAGKLRGNQTAQVKRMLADPRADALMQNFSGQWLQARDIETVQIDSRSVLARDEGATNRGRGFGFGRGRPDLDADLRKSMRLETERYFNHIVREDRSVTELIDSDYTFLNERLAKHYGLTNLNVTGTELQRITLPPNSPRGGVLTHGTVLAVTSNPTRTSPVKRGLFVLENILGTPPPPPPPDIPPLEDAGKEVKDRVPTLRETLELHRSKPVCSSCHNRMDPLGLALENFNAMGMWREKELNQPVEVSGRLITGEDFTNIRDVKRILATKHHLDFYQTLTEKLLTYALGRGLEYHDVQTVDQIVVQMDKENGRFSALLMGIVESAPFQKRRTANEPENPKSAKPLAARTETKRTP